MCVSDCVFACACVCVHACGCACACVCSCAWDSTHDKMCAWLLTQALEKDMEKLSQTHEKLCGTESEIRTLKTFLTTKTALIEKHKKDLREARTKIADLEEKDRRRAVILADVLEKTARQYQQQLGRKPQSVGGAGGGLSPPGKRRQPDLQVTLLDDQRYVCST